jgi:hypothetical protein
MGTSLSHKGRSVTCAAAVLILRKEAFLVVAGARGWKALGKDRIQAGEGRLTTLHG